MKLWIIDDSRTRFCKAEMRAFHGRWDPAVNAWSFRNLDDATDALRGLYSLTRATPTQREMLENLIDEGIAAHAWDMNLASLEREAWLAALSREEASAYIGQALAAARLLNNVPFEDRMPKIESDAFDASAFERGMQQQRTRRKAA